MVVMKLSTLEVIKMRENLVSNARLILLGPNYSQEDKHDFHRALASLIQHFNRHCDQEIAWEK